jgi:predicted RNA-binding protein with PUA-like domain
MAYWLLKSEPSSYSWDQLMADGRTHWDGVRNAQALNNLRAMKLGDRAFFYHSNEGKEIVGVAEVARSFYPDPADKSGKLGMIDIKPVIPAAVPVGLKEMRSNPELSGLSLLKQSRLSVCPITETEWSALCKMMGIPADTEVGKSS